MPLTSSPSSSSFFSDKFRKRFQDEIPPHVPSLTLDREGTIQEITQAARRTLEYSSDASIEPCFFSHVHYRNLRRVMQDLAHMVHQRKQRTHWLLRLRTGNGRWRWYRAAVENHLDHAEGSIRVHLRSV